LRDSPLARALVDGGAWVMSEDTLEYQRARAHLLDTLVMQDVPLADIAKADTSFKLDALAPARLDLSPREIWSDLLLRTHRLLREALQGAALTMNYGASDAHDRMAAQTGPAKPAQRQAMAAHG
jgi:hypothetical protein